MRRKNGETIMEWMEELQHDGIIRYLDIFNTERLAIVGPKALSEVLVQKSYEFVKPAQLRKGLGRILGVGLFLSEGDEHKMQRKNLMPAFAFRHIKNLYPIFWSKASEMADALSKLVNEDQDFIIDANNWSSRTTLDIIGVAGMGHDFHAIADPNTDLNVTYRRLFAPSRSARLLGILSFILPSWFIRMLPIRRNNDIVASAGVIKRTCRSLIEEKRTSLAKSAFEKDAEPVRPDILSIAMDSGAFLDADASVDNDLTNQLMTFLIAGHETVAASLSWALYALCQYPDVQKRLREEVLLRLGAELSNEKAAPITSESIDSLPYLSAFCSEVLRLWPPVVLTVRVADCNTSILGTFVPKGTVLILAPLATNRSTALWGGDANEFNPDRWMKPGQANSGGADTNFAQMTFLHGPRSCIGQSFARAEFVCLVAMWVGRFKETRFADEKYIMEVRNGITARPDAHKVKVTV
ncbi:hypothetical protein MMC25_001373 [Agyrium rufum]|nr:hypothetical protein [Agyrium rufum]